MRLLDLDPHWYVLEDGGPIVGLSFYCPHCRKERLGILFHHDGHAAIEDGYIRAHYPNDPQRYIWTMTGPADFATLTLSPSVDASKSGHWHGSITNGECR
jgi:hypothetical protein